jgi:hypothetical protein
LFAALAGAGDEGLGEAGLVFFAGVGGVALLDAGVVAGFANFAAWLGAVRAWDSDILAFTWPVTEFLAFVGATLELVPTGKAASSFPKPTWLVLQRLLATDA